MFLLYIRHGLFVSIFCHHDTGSIDVVNTFCKHFELFAYTHYSFSRVQFALVGQENQDANLGEDNYIFFLSGTAIGKAVCVCTSVYFFSSVSEIILKMLEPERVMIILYNFLPSTLK